jgi:enoyl-CoA hydratase/carnithine racemase
MTRADDFIVRTERRDRVLVISMRRPEKRNAIDEKMTRGLDAALNELDDDPAIWVGVLTGTATVFSAGTDLAEGAGPPTERGGEYGLVRRRRRKPLIAAVEGFALGGGMELVLACDMVVASSTARFGLPEVNRGVIATCGGLFRTAQTLPLNLAREMILTGQPIDAPRAQAMGLVNVLADPGTALDQALAMASRIAANSPSAVQASLTAIQQCLPLHDPAGWKATQDAHSAVQTSPDYREGIDSFLQKRPPRWAGA